MTITVQDDDDIETVCMEDVLHALEEAIEAAPADKRKALADAINGYAESFPEDFGWAIGAQAPSLLRALLMSMNAGTYGPSMTPDEAIRRMRAFIAKTDPSTAASSADLAVTLRDTVKAFGITR